MRKKEKLIINLNNKPTPIFFIIFLLIIILSVSPRVYTKSRKQELKGKSSSFSSKPSTQSKKMPQYRSRSTPSPGPTRSSPPPMLENKNRSGGWGISSANQGKSSKLERKTGTATRKPGRNFRQQDQNTQKRSPGGHINKNRDHRKQHPQYYGNNSCVSYPYGETRYYDEEYVESPDSEYPPTSRESNGLPAGQEREYHINDSFSLDPVLVEKIDEYNAKNQIGLEYPLTRWSASLTYQLLDSQELIEHMEKKIQYYKQQLDAVRNSKLSPAEKEIWERFWLERIQRLQESKQKEEDRVSELRSGITDEHRKLE